MLVDNLLNKNLDDLLVKYPHIDNFFDSYGLDIKNIKTNIKEYIEDINILKLENFGIDKNRILKDFVSYVEQMERIRRGTELKVKKITILGGQNKFGEKEKIRLELEIGDVISIVGPTGSGKSRLLADIEWMAQGDSPTKRTVLINDILAPKSLRFSMENKLVAQLSQNMNFVMDISVYDFIKMHAESRMVEDVEEKIKNIIYYANELSGEKFDLNTALTSLSGGQSRALMVADTAFLSSSPIVLIDEIENAGINRKKALELLVKKEKIVLIATHDPLIALLANKRIVIKNGAIQKVIESNNKEKEQVSKLELLDKLVLEYRHRLRQGESLNLDNWDIIVNRS